mmetsp:Transcript_26589/g.45252  ORF Transcript_26589/g.45252 Transcript_26589/m.45252 type:complete len:219 (+) Transcript_26589:26-682(+)
MINLVISTPTSNPQENEMAQSRHNLLYTIGTCPVEPYFSIYSFCLLASALAKGELSAANCPHEDPPNDTAPCAGVGAAAATAGSAATGVGAAGAGVGAAAATTGSGAFTSSTGATEASVAEVSGALPATKSLNAATSSSSSTVTIIGTPTVTSPAPASTIIFPTTPSSCASKSIVALSVSITARESPATNDSPSATFHLDIVPASMVGDRAGIPTTMW